MKDQDKTKAQLISELKELKGQIALLQETESPASSLMDTVPLGVTECDIRGMITLVNPAFEAITGYSSEELIGMSVADLIADGPQKETLLDYFAHLASEQPPPSPYRCKDITKDGRLIDVQVDWAYKHNPQGQVAGFISIVSDITEKMQAEEALRQSEQRLSLHFQQTPLAAIEWDAGGRVTKWNPSAERIFGYAQEEALGRHFSFIVPADCREQVAHVSDDLFCGRGGKRGTNENVTKDGRTILCEWYNTPLIDAEGQVFGAASLAQDITEQKRTEEALRVNEERTRQAVRAANLGVFEHDHRTDVIQWSAEMRQIYGIGPEEPVSISTILEFYHPDDREGIAAAIQRAHDPTGDGVYSADSRIIRRDGTVRWLIRRSKTFFDNEAGLPRLIRTVGVVMDITDRKRTEEALQKAKDELEERVRERTTELQKANEELDIFRRFAEAASQGFGMADMDGFVTYMNPALSRMAGFANSEYALGKHLTALYPEGYLLRRKTEILPTILQDGHWEGELAVAPAGKTIYILQNSFLIKDEKGNPSRLASVITDITERKRTEEALRQSEERFRSYFEQGLVGMAVSTADNRWIQVNDRYCDMLGYSRDELLGMKWTDIAHPDDLERNLVLHNRSLAGEIEHYTLEIRFFRKDGSMGYAAVFARCFRRQDGSVDHFLALVEEITERKRAEAALRQSEESLKQSERRFRNYFEQGLIGMAVTALDKRWLEVNDRLCEMLGYSREELVQTNWAALTHPDDLEANLQLFHPLLTGAIEHFTLNKRYLKKDRSIVHTTIYARAFRKEDGTIDHVVTLIEDITARKQAEEALQQSHAELRSIYDGMRDGLLVADIETKKLVRCNAAMLRMLGYAEDELLSRSVMDIHPADEVPSVLERFRGLVDGRQKVVQGIPVLRKDGSIFYADISHNEFAYNGRNCTAGFFRDITERKQAEDALRASEERFRTYFVQGLVGMSITGLDMRWQEVNDRLCEILGYSREELLRMTWTELTHPDDLDESLRLYNRLRGGEIDHYVEDKRYVRKDGKPVYTSVFVRCSRRTDGTVDRILGLTEDVTTRKQAQEALAESEKKYRLLIETTDTGYVILDGEGRIIDANAEYLRISGQHTLEEILGRTVVEWTAPYDVDRNAKEVEKCCQKGFVRQLEIDYVHPDGRIVPIDINATCLDTEDGRRIVCLCRDITERREAQEALRVSEERYELAVQGVGVGLWDWDIRTGKLYFSPRWRMLFGYDENDVGDSLEDWARLLHPDERDWMIKYLEDFLAGTSPTVTVEYRLRHKDGSYRWIEAHAVVVRDRQGKAHRLVGSHGDITDRKRAEEALERERQSLWRMLQASDHERQIISYEIHDGLAQYLAAAGMQFQTHEALRENSPEEAKKAYETAVELVRQSHFEARRLISEVRPPVIDEVGIETAISHLVHEQRRHGGPKIECHSDVQFGRLPSILENALYRIAQEALTNACKHSQSKKVTVSMGQEGQDVRLEVQDWGIGFDPESIEKGHFGLEGIRQRVRLLGGRLTIESTPGSGTLIQVVVPILERRTER